MSGNGCTNSAPHTTWARLQRGLSPIERCVLITLCDRANADMICFPSVDLIAQENEVSRRAVIYALEALCGISKDDKPRAKLIELIEDKNERRRLLARAGGNVDARTNIYRVLRDHTGNGKEQNEPQPMNGAYYAPIEGANPAPIAETSANDAPVAVVQQVHRTPKIGANFAPESPNIESSIETPVFPDSGNNTVGSHTHPSRVCARETASIFRNPPRWKEFIDAYPPNDGSLVKAKLTYAQVVADGIDPAVLIDAVKVYPFREGRYTVHAVTWLQERRWEAKVENPDRVERIMARFEAEGRFA
jgi:hypothetical protein